MGSAKRSATDVGTHTTVSLGWQSASLTVTIKAGDSLAMIARAEGSTPEIMKKLNPMENVLRPGYILKLQKGTVQHVITGWRQITTEKIAQRYNGGGEPSYAKKLDYALGLVRK